jgi:chemotaxis protein methyltransferase CheR
MKDNIAELARMIEEATGFVVSPRSYGHLTGVAREQIAALKLSGIDEYLDLLSMRSESPVWRILLGRITVKESYLFRGRAQFDALSGAILHEIAANRTDRRLRVWCAGCARGEEAVTLAIVLASHPVVGGWDWEILATDVDEEALDEARSGIYGKRAVASVPTEILGARFTPRHDRFAIDPDLLARINYQRLNLADPGNGYLEPPFDVIFLRNVLIYFRPEVQKRVVKTVERSLARHGALFLGPSESLLPLEASLKPRDLGTCFCYEWRSSTDETRSDRLAVAGSREHRSPADEQESTAPSLRPAKPVGQIEGRGIGGHIDRVLEALVEADFEGAKRAALILRREFPESPLSHALAGVAASRAGERGSAVEAYRAALYLNPNAPEIRFLLAQALEANGQPDRALREYRSVVTLLGAGPVALSPVLAAAGTPEKDQIMSISRRKMKLKE